MSEHWRSTPKYWCKHCTIYVKDTPFERKQHESTGKHQGNLRRFLQGIQNDHAKGEREKEKAKAEVERLNRITGSGSGSTIASPSSTSAPLSTPSTTSKSSSSHISAADQKRQWAQLAEMGIAIPENARAEVAMTGDWQIVAKKLEDEPDQYSDNKLNIGVHKRKFDDEEAETAVNDTSNKGWGSAIRFYPGVKQVDEDLSSLLAAPLMTKPKKTHDPQENSHASSSNVETSKTMVAMKPEPAQIDHSILQHTHHRDEQASSAFSTLGSEIAAETPTRDANSQSQNLSVPMFKKRKVKQPQHAASTTG